MELYKGTGRLSTSFVQRVEGRGRNWERRFPQARLGFCFIIIMEICKAPALRLKAFLNSLLILYWIRKITFGLFPHGVWLAMKKTSELYAYVRLRSLKVLSHSWWPQLKSSLTYHACKNDIKSVNRFKTNNKTKARFQIYVRYSHFKCWSGDQCL